MTETSHWATCRFGDLAEFRNGVNYTASHRGPGVRTINVKDFGDRFRPIWSDLDELDASVVPAQAVLRDGDIVFVRSNGNRDLIGRSMYIDGVPPEPTTHSAFTIRARVIDPKALPKFYAYFFRSPVIRQVLSAHGGGTNISNLNQEILSSLIVPLPPLRVQQRVVELLGAYDDLRDVNVRRIAILEEMSRRLFDEWFDRLRFPGSTHQGAASSLPDGWQAGSLSALVDFIGRGIAPLYSENQGGLVVNQRCIRDHRLDLEPARRQTRSVPSDKRLRAGDVLINSTGVGTLGRVARVFEVPPDTTVDSHVTIVRPRSGVDADFFGLLLLGLQPDFERAGVGTTGQTELSRRVIADAPVNIPPAELAAQFGNLVNPLQVQVQVLSAVNARLVSATRLLLPKLVCGELPVSAFFDQLEAA